MVTKAAAAEAAKSQPATAKSTEVRTAGPNGLGSRAQRANSGLANSAASREAIADGLGLGDHTTADALSTAAKLNTALAATTARNRVRMVVSRKRLPSLGAYREAIRSWSDPGVRRVTPAL